MQKKKRCVSSYKKKKKSIDQTKCLKKKSRLSVLSKILQFTNATTAVIFDQQDNSLFSRVIKSRICRHCIKMIIREIFTRDEIHLIGGAFYREERGQRNVE